MSELTILRDVVTIVGVIVGFTYYVINVRNAQRIQQQLETRQLQLYHATIQDSHNKPWMLAYIDVMYGQEWADFEEFWRKYGPHTNPDAYTNFMMVAELMTEMGVFLEQNAIDPILLYKHNGPVAMRIWEKIEPVVRRLRQQNIRLSTVWMPFERLYQTYQNLEQRESTSAP
jgi:hypothetical protein